MVFTGFCASGRVFAFYFCSGCLTSPSVCLVRGRWDWGSLCNFHGAIVIAKFLFLEATEGSQHHLYVCSKNLILHLWKFSTFHRYHRCAQARYPISFSSWCKRCPYYVCKSHERYYPTPTPTQPPTTWRSSSVASRVYASRMNVIIPTPPNPNHWCSSSVALRVYASRMNVIIPPHPTQPQPLNVAAA